MVARTIEVYDNDFMIVANSSPSLTPGTTIINNSDTPDGTIFEFAGGSPSVVTLDDTSANTAILEDDEFSHHTIKDGGGLVASGTGVEAESLIYVRALDEAGNQVGPLITVTVFSQGNTAQDVWAYHSDVPLVEGQQYVKTGGDNIGSSPYARISSQPVCYAAATMIDTPCGARPIHALKVGDLVTTLDSGPQVIRWLRRGVTPLSGAATEACPVRIGAGALGAGHPARDLLVSPQHRILVGGYTQLQELFRAQAFAPAKSLTALEGIRHDTGVSNFKWFHFACDRHEVVFANGCLSESLLLGQMVLNGLSAAERGAMTRIFQSATAGGAPLNGPPARTCLTVGAVRRQIARCRPGVVHPLGAVSQQPEGNWRSTAQQGARVASHSTA